jgi:hypothetical protein
LVFESIYGAGEFRRRVYSYYSSSFINRAWKPDADWFGQYTGTYTAIKASGVPDIQAHNLARAAADAGRFLPAHRNTKTAFQNAKNTTSVKAEQNSTTEQICIITRVK